MTGWLDSANIKDHAVTSVAVGRAAAVVSLWWRHETISEESVFPQSLLLNCWNDRTVCWPAPPGQRCVSVVQVTARSCSVPRSSRPPQPVGCNYNVFIDRARACIAITPHHCPVNSDGGCCCCLPRLSLSISLLNLIMIDHSTLIFASTPPTGRLASAQIQYNSITGYETVNTREFATDVGVELSSLLGLAGHWSNLSNLSPTDCSSVGTITEPQFTFWQGHACGCSSQFLKNTKTYLRLTKWVHTPSHQYWELQMFVGHDLIAAQPLPQPCYPATHLRSGKYLHNSMSDQHLTGN